MNQKLRRTLVIASIFTLVICLGIGSSFAEHDYTTECGGCHTVSGSYTLTSNATGIVNVTVGTSFTLRFVAQKPVFGGTNFWLSVRNGWADNDNFDFTEEYIQDGSGGDLTLANFIVTHDFTFTPTVSGNQTIRAWCSTSSSSQFLDVVVNVTDVPDETPPTVDSPSDIAYTVYETGHNIVWTPFDDFPERYNVQMNGTVILSGGWNGLPIVINVDYLSPGIYEYNLTVFDASGNTVFDVVIVTVTGEVTATTTTTTTTTTTETTSTSSPTSSTTSGGNPVDPGDDDEALVNTSFSLIMVSTGIIVGILVLLLIVDKWRS